MNYKLNRAQQKVVAAVAKSEARTQEQVVSILLDQGLDFFYCEHTAIYEPYVHSETFDKDLTDDIKRIANGKDKDKDKDVISLPVVSPIKEVHVMHKEVRQGQL